MATIEEVAREAGVSISTVSYALSGKRSIRESTRQRVLDAAGRLGYLPNASARMLATDRSHIIAVVAPLHADTDQTAHMAFAFETTRAARTRDYDTLLLVHDDALEGMKRTVGTSLADGIIVLDVDTDDQRADFARTVDCPTVFIGIPGDTSGIICVDLDFEEAARRAVDRLVDSGCVNIGLVTHSAEVLERRQNFPIRFISTFTLHAESRGVSHAVAVPSGADATAVLDSLTKELPHLDGIVLNTDSEVARSVVSGLVSRGLKIPGDVAVIAAGVPYSTERFPVALDTIPLDPRESCELAVSILVRTIDEGFVAPEKTLIPPTYIDRGSVQPGPSSIETLVM